MPKVVLIMKRKKGVTHQQFRDHYENSHAPLARKFFGKFITGYQRNYIQQDPNVSHTDGGPSSDYDVITEISYRDTESMEAMWAANTEPEIRDALAADGEEYFDTSDVRFYVVNETTSSDV